MFLQRPRPYSDESLESFFIRVANKNGYRDVTRFMKATKHFLQDENPDLYQTFPTDISRINPYSSSLNSASRTHAFRRLSQLTFNEPPNILGLAVNRTSMTFSPSTSGLIRGAELIPRSLLRKGHIPVCPICLDELGYANYRWHFVGYNCCGKHKVALTNHCSCGKAYDYRISGLEGNCEGCGCKFEHDADDCNTNELLTACWLEGQEITPLPSLPKSYRWGLVHWWVKSFDDTFNAETFVNFWKNWPNSFHDYIESEISFNLEHATVDKAQLRIKDLLNRVFFNSVHLPDRNFRYNIVLKELFAYLDKHIWDDHGILANLKMNALEACVLLNCSLEQVASMVEQRLLCPNRVQKQASTFKPTHYVFHLGDVYCLWLSDFQTDEFNRSFYVSRW